MRTCRQAFSKMATQEIRFAELSETDLHDLVNYKDALSTPKVIQNAVAILRYYYSSKNLDVKDVEQYEVTELNEFLRRFYAEARTSNGEYYVH
ncbi:hypothetical protein GAY54_14380 [Staphylococcus aureus]|uniref:Uncharacterized protein n=2 Tax=Staphylococcus aureus TaxID=1280 RepID=A0AB73JKB0_STAAU|nr:hypothetical protein [Staphylococcus aureus]